MLLQMTVQVEVPTREAGRGLAEAAGFTVTRVTTPTVKAGATTPPRPDVRADSRLDRPEGLDPLETVAYVRGYAEGCMAFVKKFGIPRGQNRKEIHAATVEAEWARHPMAHKKGMAALVKEREYRAAYEAAHRAALQEVA